MLTLYKKEINSFLNSILGYIVIVVFLIVNGMFLWIFPMETNILDFGYANLDGLFMLAPFVFLFPCFMLFSGNAGLLSARFIPVRLF